jgi:uncharacterized protein YegP (UPF0339 family)
MEDFMAAKFEIYKDRAKRYRFRLKATNGEIIASGEAYDTKAACIKGIKSVQKSAPAAAIIDPEEEAQKAAAAKKAAVKKEPRKTGASEAASPDSEKKPRRRKPKEE